MQPNLISAVIAHDIKAVNLFLTNGTDVNVRDSMGETILMVACRCVHKKKNIEIVKLLLQYGADVNIQDINGCNSLIIALQYLNIDIIKLLLEEGADPNLRDNMNRTALLYAVRCHSIEIIKLLIDFEADINIQDDYGQSPLMAALGNNGPDTIEIIELLIKLGADVNLCDGKGLNILTLAASNFYRNNRLKIIELLLKNGADPNLYMINGDTTITYIADYYGYTNITDTMKLLLSYGANVNFINSYGNTAFIESVKASVFIYDSVMIDMFIDAGTDLNIIANDGNTVLTVALHKKYNLKTIKKLLKGGANPNIYSKYSTSPIVIAIDNGSFEHIKLLVLYNANLDLILHRIPRSYPVEIVKYLIDYGAKIHDKLTDAGFKVDIDTDMKAYYDTINSKRTQYRKCFTNIIQKDIILAFGELLYHPDTLRPKLLFIQKDTPNLICPEVITHFSIRDQNSVIKLDEYAKN